MDERKLSLGEFVMRNKISGFLGLGLISQSALYSNSKAEDIRAWSAPKWGFVQPLKFQQIPASDDVPVASFKIEIQKSALSKSLIFDQSFDKISFRKWEEAPARSIVTVSQNSSQVIAMGEVSTSTQDSLSTNLNIPVNQFLKVATIQAMHSQNQNSLSNDIENLSGQSLNKPVFTPALDEPSSFDPSNELLHTEDELAAQNSIYLRSSQKLAEKLNSTFESIEQSQSTSSNFALIPQQGISPEERIRLDGITKAAPTTVARAGNDPIVDSSHLKDNNHGKQLVDPGTQQSPDQIRLTPLAKAQKNSKIAQILVIDEESHSLGQNLGIEKAKVTWLGFRSGLSTRSAKGGLLQAPYKAIQSMRFIVQAPGYLPAVGYASRGWVTPVFLYKESRFSPVVKSLNVTPDPSKVMVFGKVVNKNLQALAHVSIDTSVSDPFKVFYATGEMGLFHPKALSTGPTGEFFVSGVNRGIQYFMPTQFKKLASSFSELDGGAQEWPAHIFNLSGVGPIVSTTIQESTSHAVTTQIVDAFGLERPSGVGITVSVGGQRGVHVPDENGDVQIPSLQTRSTPDLIEVRAQGYINTWISSSDPFAMFPKNIAIFTQRQIDTLLAESLSDIQLSRGIVFGHLRTAIFDEPVQVRIFDSYGKKAEQAKVLYFDERNLARSSLSASLPKIQNFAVANLSPGEWQVIAISEKTQQVVGAQVIRVDDNTVSQLQF